MAFQFPPHFYRANPSLWGLVQSLLTHCSLQIYAAVLQVSLINALKNLRSIFPKKKNHLQCTTALNHIEYFLPPRHKPGTDFTLTTRSGYVPSSQFLQSPNKLTCLFNKTGEIWSRYFLTKSPDLKYAHCHQDQHCESSTTPVLKGHSADNRPLIKR